MEEPVPQPKEASVISVTRATEVDPDIQTAAVRVGPHPGASADQTHRSNGRSTQSDPAEPGEPNQRGVGVWGVGSARGSFGSTKGNGSTARRSVSGSGTTGRGPPLQGSW